MYLGSGECWTFAAPRYHGEKKTRLRFRLDREKGQAPVTSNEFEGSVNPEQFTTKEGHTPQGVMDPYDD